MRNWILAAVAALAVEQAEARTITYKFTGTGDTVALDVTPGTALSFWQSIKYLNDGLGETFERPILDAPYMSTAGGFPYDGSFGAEVDAKGRIISLRMNFDLLGDLVGWSTNRYERWSIWGENGEELLEAVSGSWVRLSPVPLPATAPMLLIGAASLLGLGKLRVRMRRKF